MEWKNTQLFVFYIDILFIFWFYQNKIWGGEGGKGFGWMIQDLDKGGVNSNKAYGYFQLFCMANIVLVHAGTRYGVWDLICDFFI